MNIILFDGNSRSDLLPLTFTRPVAEIRVGIFSIRQKWEHILSATCSWLTEDYLTGKFPLALCDDNLFVAGNLLPDSVLAEAVAQLKTRESLCAGDQLLAYRGVMSGFEQIAQASRIEFGGDVRQICQVYDVFTRNSEEIEADFRRITCGRTSAKLSPTVQIIGEQYFADGTPKLFVEEGVVAECATINLKNGPVYLGRDVEIMEGSHIRAPFAACEHAVVNMGAKIYGPTTLGPYCKVGGELNNVVMFGYSNKAHDGFLGNAVIGEWCNLGAGTESSNLKNDYSEVRIWNYPSRRFAKTGLQFCGLIMGDYSKAGINTLFNTATVVGVGCNVYGSDFPRVFIPSFNEGGASGFERANLKKFFVTTEKVKARRGIALTDADRAICEKVFELDS